MLLMYRPFDIGDAVEVAGVMGVVDSMSLVSTTINTFDNRLVVIPNNSIWGGVITNITGNDTRRVDMVFGIGYSDDIDKASRILSDVIDSHEKVLRDPAPVIKVHELADSSVNFVARPWAQTADYWDVYWDVTRKVKERFDAEGVSIPFPQRDVHMYQESGA
jgi:small conductance mechanosensitive channel